MLNNITDRQCQKTNIDKSTSQRSPCLSLCHPRVSLSLLTNRSTHSDLWRFLPTGVPSFEWLSVPSSWQYIRGRSVALFIGTNGLTISFVRSANPSLRCTYLRGLWLISPRQSLGITRRSNGNVLSLSTPAPLRSPVIHTRRLTAPVSIASASTRYTYLQRLGTLSPSWLYLRNVASDTERMLQLDSWIVL